MNENAKTMTMDLQDAFQQFSVMSEHLALSYHELEQRIGQLCEELESVSEQRYFELAEKERLANRLETLFKVLPVGIIALDESGHVLESNPLAEELLGEELKDKAWVDIIKSAFAPRSDDGYEVSLVNGKRVSILTQSLDPESGQLIVITDLTETRALQASLSQHQRLSELGKMSAKLAHQIRTPLATALLYSGQLDQKYSQKILQPLQQIEQQIGDMLAFSKGNTQSVARFTIHELFDDVEQTVAANLNQLNAKLTIDNHISDEELLGNQAALSGALQNLINNALDAAGENANVILKAHITQDNKIALTVEDDGPGMSPEIIEQAMQPFYTTRSQGTGLGLAVVNAVAQAHQGEISIRSETNKGTTVNIILPRLNNNRQGMSHE